MPRTNTRLGQAQEDMENGETLFPQGISGLFTGFLFPACPVCFDHVPSFCFVPPFSSSVKWA